LIVLIVEFAPVLVDLALLLARALISLRLRVLIVLQMISNHVTGACAERAANGGSRSRRSNRRAHYRACASTDRGSSERPFLAR
jgi:hypothetical protein